jgi:hypothetical protein
MVIKDVSNDTRILKNFIEMNLVKEKKELLSYAELGSSVGMNDIRNRRGILKTAVRHVQNDNGVLIRTVPSVGIKLSDDYSGTLERTRIHVRRMAKRRVNEVLNASEKDTNIKNDDKIRLLSEVSILGAIAQFSSNNSMKKIVGKVTEKNVQLSLNETLKMFG